MKINWTYVRTFLVLLFISILAFLIFSVLWFLAINGMWHQIFGGVIWIGVIFGVGVIAIIVRVRLDERFVEKIRKLDADEQKREDEVLLQAVAFSQSVSFFMTTLLLDGSPRLIIGAMTASFAVVFYIVRAWAKVKDSPLHRYISMLILSFVGASTLMAIFSVAAAGLLVLTPVSFDLGLYSLVPLVFGFFGGTMSNATSDMLKKRYGIGEHIGWKLIIKNLVHQWFGND
jgi:hypothetical protein